MVTRELQLADAGKFWTVIPDGSRFSIRYGKLGSKGQLLRKTCSSEAEAQRIIEDLIQKKLKAGYVEVGVAALSLSAARPGKPEPAAAKPVAQQMPAPASSNKAVRTRTEGGAARSIDLAPADWLWATWRPRQPLERTARAAFDLDGCLARLGRVTARRHGWEWAWDKAELSVSMTPEEAHFWLVAMTDAEQQLKPGDVAAKLAGQQFSGRVAAGDVVNRFKRGRLGGPELVIVLPSLLGFDALVDLVVSEQLVGAGWTDRDHFLLGFRRYLLPYLSEKETTALRQACRPAITAKGWPTDYHARPPVAFHLGAMVGGLGQELGAVIESWPADLYRGDDWHDHYHTPQLVIFGLDSAGAVEAEFRRLKLRLRQPVHVRAWLAHTEASALDVVRDSVLAEQNRDAAAGLLEVFCRVHAPEAAPHMLALKLGSKAPALARAWLEENLEHTLVGLAPIAGERGKLGEAALELLREVKRGGNEQAVAAAARSAGGEVATRVKRLVLDHVEKTYAPFEGRSTPKWLAVLSASPGKAPGWATPAALPPLVVGDRRLGDEQVAALLGVLRASTLVNPPQVVVDLKKNADPDAIDAFVWRLLERWLGEGAPSKEKWALLAVGLLGGNGAALKLAPLVRSWPGEGQHQRAVTGLECLRAIGSDTALMQLNGIAQKLKFKALKQRAMALMEAIATDRGMTRSQLEDRIVPDCDLDERGCRAFDFGGRSFTFVLDPQMKAMVRDGDGRVKPDLPKPGAKDDAERAAGALAAWKRCKKQVQEVARVQAVRLEQAMVMGRRWSVAEFETLLLKHPLMTHLARLLVWGGYDKSGKLAATFRVTEDQACADAGDAAVGLSKLDLVGIVHPMHLDDATRAAWGQIFSDYRIIPPFPQLGRPVFSLEQGEEEQRELCRFKGKVPAVSLVGTLESLAWERGRPEDAGVFHEHTKPFYGAKVSAVVQYPGVPVGNMVDVEDQEVEKVFFVPGIYTPQVYPQHEKAVALGKVDPVAVSEVLSDMSTLLSKAR